MRVNNLEDLLHRNPDIKVERQGREEPAEGRKIVRQALNQSLEQLFLTLWQQLEGPGLEREYRFDLTRRWRFDFAHIPTKVAIEIEGGTWVHGRHNRALGYNRDCEKYNAATAQGWHLFRLTSNMLTEDYLRLILDFIVQQEKTS